MGERYRVSMNPGIVRLLLPSLIGLLLGVQCIWAQPGDPIKQYEKFAKKLKILDGQISQTPDNANLYFQRGSLYLGMFSSHPQIVEFRGIVYATDPGTKALADLNRAIKIERRSEFFAARGKYYQERWYHKLSRESGSSAASWEKVRQLFWENESFESAVKIIKKP